MKISPVCLKMEKDFQDAGITRKTGEGYESHPYEVARILIELFDEEHLTNDDIIAALLHDHVEDIHLETFDSLQEKYGDYVAFVVHLLSKVYTYNSEGNKVFFENFKDKDTLYEHIEKESRELGCDFSTESLKKIAKTVALIKISDRIHNLFTMPEDYFGAESIDRKINETEEYLVYLAQQWSRDDTKVLDMLRKSILHASKVSNRIKIKEKLSVEPHTSIFSWVGSMIRKIKKGDS